MARKYEKKRNKKKKNYLDGMTHRYQNRKEEIAKDEENLRPSFVADSVRSDGHPSGQSLRLFLFLSMMNGTEFFFFLFLRSFI